jgi:hypothetical protein
MPKIKVTLILLILSSNILSQQNFSSMHPFFKDRMYYSNQQYEGYLGNSFFPATENDYHLSSKIADTSKQYYTFTNVLFKKHLLEFKGDNYYLTISPVFDLSRSKDFNDTSNRLLFQNTRGFLIEGDLMKNVSFSTSLFENQSRNPLYQSSYYRSLGELYPNSADSTYQTQNAVIPGATRTKPFKGDGFDYGYAIGNIIYKPIKSLTLSAGNNAHFIGDGYRSMLLSDNSSAAPYFQIHYKINPRWELVYLRSKLLNLTRRPANTSVEAYYQPKGYAVNYLTYKITRKLNISLFEGTIYSRGDSVTSTRSNPLFYNPIPVLSSLLMKEENANSILGLNIGYSPNAVWRLYGQVAFNRFSETLGGQIGTRISQPWKITNLFIQLEGNFAPNNLYTSTTSRLNYSHYNLPMGHTKGEGFSEVVVRINYEWKRMYFDVKSIYYSLSNFSDIALLPVQVFKPGSSGSIMNSEFEIGYRFNRKLNFSIFANGMIRYATTPISNNSTTLISFGIRTGLLNHYTDF